MSSLGIDKEAIDDCQKAISLARKYEDATPLDDPSRLEGLHNIALHLKDRYEDVGLDRYLDEAIRFAFESAKSTDQADSAWLERWNDYANILGMRFELKGGLEDREESIRLGRELVRAAPVDHPERAAICHSLSVALFGCSTLTGSPGDLDEAILLEKEAVRKAQDPYNRATYYHTLANALGERYQLKEEDSNFKQALDSMKAALHLASPDDHRLLGFYNTLANLYGTKYKAHEGLGDLEIVVEWRRKVLLIASGDHPHRALALSNLGQSLYDRFLRLGDLLDLEGAIAYERQAVALTQEHHSQHADRIDKLGGSLHALYDRTGSLEALEESIEYGGQALRKAGQAADSAALRAKRLNNSAIRLASYFDESGDRESMEKAIQQLNEAVAIATPALSKLVFMRNLSGLFQSRFEILGAIKDLEQAIQIARDLIDNTPKDHPTLSFSLEALASTLQSKSKRSRHLPSIEEAITIQGRAVEATPVGHPLRAQRICNLGHFLLSKYELTRDPEVLKEAVQFAHNALELAQDDHPWQPQIFHSLACCYGQLKEPGEDCLGEAISYAQKAVSTIRIGHPSRAVFLFTHGTLLHERFKRDGGESDSLAAMSKLREASQQANAKPVIRIQAGRLAGLLYASNSKWEQAFEVLSGATKLLPYVTPRSLDRDDQQEALATMSGLSTLTACAALEAQECASTALTLLESGRGVMASLAIDSQTDLSNLESVAVKLFREYSALREQLSQSRPTTGTLAEVSLNPTTNGGRDHPGNIDDEISRRNRLVKRLETVETRIREEVKGYEHFQRPPPPSYFTELAKGSAALVAFNVTSTRIDAFIITEEKVNVISLPELKGSKLVSNVNLLTGKDRITDGPPSTFHQRNKKLRKILKWLWDVAVRPVLQALNLLSPEPPKKLPRLWWVTSGPMGLTPLHAAGCDWGKGTENTASHVVSSYIPTCKALAHSRERSCKALPWAGQRLLIVAMPKTTGLPDLDISTEVSLILESIKGTGIPEPEILYTPSKDELLKKLQGCTIAHLGCHGTSDSSDPSSSGLYLADRDGSPECLTVRDLAATSQCSAQLANLAACSTAENRSQDLLDEVIHVASAFLLVGFPHVVGMLWEANDNAAKDMSRIFYRELARQSEGGGSDKQDAIAYAVHETVRALRGVKNTSDNAVIWAPLIHLGC